MEILRSALPVQPNDQCPSLSLNSGPLRLEGIFNYTGGSSISPWAGSHPLCGTAVREAGRIVLPKAASYRVMPPQAGQSGSRYPLKVLKLMSLPDQTRSFPLRTLPTPERYLSVSIA